MLIDAHNHPNWLGHGGESILENMDAQGIAMAWLLTWEAIDDEYPPELHSLLPPTGMGIPLADVLEVGRRAPDRFVLGYMPHPKRPDAIDRLRAAVEIHGIRVAGELKARVPFDDPDVIRLCRFCGEQKLPVTVHLDYPIDAGQGNYPRPNWWYGGSMDALERAISACPDTVFIGHAPGFWAHISGDDRHLTEVYPDGEVLPGGRVSEMLRRYRNLWADLSASSALSALKRDAEFSRQFLIEFHDRLLFARDSYDGELAAFLTALALPEGAFARIAHLNAERLLNQYL